MTASKIKSVFTSRHLPLTMAALAIILTLPSLDFGWQLDDYFQKALLNDGAITPANGNSRFNQFVFLNGNQTRTKRLMEIGALPWWTHPDIKIAFFRPLTELTHQLDFLLWPESPEWMHLHNILWYAALVWFLALLYKRFLSAAWAGGLAALFYTVDAAHGFPVCWLANRNALIATFFGCLTLWLHDRWRRESRPALLYFALTAFTMGLLSGEFAVATCAYIFAHAMFLDTGSISARLKPLLPYAVITLVWLILRRHLDFGTYGSGSYIDPGQETALFLRALPERIIALLEGQWGMLPAQTYGFLPASGALIFLSVSLVFIVILGALLFPLVKNVKTARFFLTGMLLSLIPVAATFPDNRLLLFADIGAAGLMAQFISALFDKAAWRPASRLWRAAAYCLCGYFILFHILYSGWALRGSAPRIKQFFDHIINRPAETLPLSDRFLVSREPTAEEKAHFKGILEKQIHLFYDQDAVLINPPIAFFAVQLRIIRQVLGVPPARRFHVLGSGIVPFDVKRVDERTLEIRAKGGFTPTFLDQLFRSKAYPMSVGQPIHLSGMTVTVLSLTDDGMPERAAFRFSAPLEDPSLNLLQWHDGSFVPFSPPLEGETKYLAAVKPVN